MDGPLFGMFTNFVKSCNLNVIGRKKKKKEKADIYIYKNYIRFNVPEHAVELFLRNSMKFLF